MDNLQNALKLEILIQSQLLKQCRKTLAHAPKGRLYARSRLTQISYYQIYKRKSASGWKNVQKNITNNPSMIEALTEKMVAQDTIKACFGNIPLLKKTLSKYKPYGQEELLSNLPEKYQSALTLCREKKIYDWLTAPYEKAPFDPEQHIHETAYGELVRSKSEVIIANALYSFGIPFHYEEKFPYPSENGDFYYPDFTILLPDSSKLIWEHLGLLSEMGYCINNAYKLHNYQLNQVIIGKDLILTQDDHLGNCSSAIMYDIIEKNILPYFAGLKLNSAFIKNTKHLHSK